MFRRALTRLLGSGPSVGRLEVVHAADHATVLVGTLAAASAEERRRPVYQLLWCLEYDHKSARHAADTARLWDQLRTQP